MGEDHGAGSEVCDLDVGDGVDADGLRGRAAVVVLGGSACQEGTEEGGWETHCWWS